MYLYLNYVAKLQSFYIIKVSQITPTFSQITLTSVFMTEKKSHPMMFRSDPLLFEIIAFTQQPDITGMHSRSSPCRLLQDPSYRQEPDGPDTCQHKV